MATVIKTKNGSGAPLASDLVQGELAIDLTNKRLYTENASGTIIELGTVPSTIDINAGTIDGTVIGGSTAAAGSFTTLTASGEITANGGIALGDNDKATFGASDDLQIYHDGSNSYISDTGTGRLNIQSGSSIVIEGANGDNFFSATENGDAAIYYDNAVKLSTTATGVDVTGTVTADGLSVDGNAAISSSNVRLDLFETDTTDLNTRFRHNGGQLLIRTTTDDGLTDTTRMSIDHSTGDVSLFEDTGTTAKFFWDASAESLGIGTTSPSAKLSIYDSSSADSTGLVISNGYTTDTAGDSTEIMFQHYRSYAPSVTDSAFIKATKTQAWDATSDRTSKLEFGTRNGANEPETRMTIDNAGNVGIGTSSPSLPLDVHGGTIGVTSASAFAGLQITSANSSFGYINFGDPQDGNIGQIQYDHTSNFMKFTTNNTERMRLTSDGNLLVGKTSSGIATSGVELTPSDRSSFTRESGFPILVNRTGSDGEIINIRKDGTTVGSIGTQASSTFGLTSSTRQIIIGSNDTGLYTYDSINSISPINPLTAALRDDAINLGYSAARFKDLYLSGGVYLGGTGAANHLDDYEEGTWTIALAPATSGTLTVNPSFDTGAYTKIGRLVTVQGACSPTSISSPVGAYYTLSLPFAIATDIAELGDRAGTTIVYTDGGVLESVPCLLIAGESVVRIYKDCSLLAANDDTTFSFSYNTN